MRVRRIRLKEMWLRKKGYSWNLGGLMNYERFESLQSWLASRGQPIPTGVTVLGDVGGSPYALVCEFAYADDVVEGPMAVTLRNYPDQERLH